MRLDDETREALGFATDPTPRAARAEGLDVRADDLGMTAPQLPIRRPLYPSNMALALAHAARRSRSPLA